jgi:hypothetical protein
LVTEQLDGVVVGAPRMFLRVEGAVLMAASVVGFAATDRSWWLVPAVLLLPDIFMTGYARSRRFGALTYNLAHSYPAPAVLGAVGLWNGSPLVQALALVWFAHIGMDRALGYGLKHEDGFMHTHLGIIGTGVPRRRANPARH